MFIFVGQDVLPAVSDHAGTRFLEFFFELVRHPGRIEEMSEGRVG
jgi:hypothetical protein